MRRLAAATIAVLVAACSPDTVTSTTTTTEVFSSTTGPTTTSAPVTTTTQDDVVTLLVPPTSALGPAWEEMLIPYGPGEDTLGVAPGGEGLMLGPEYGVQVPDGTWWFLDAAKMRYAHFSEGGEYLGEAEFPTQILTQGLYFQFQMPQALDDGSVIASGFRGEASSELLRFADGVFTTKAVDASVPWALTDGDLLYGFSAADDTAHSLDPETAEPQAVEWFLARDGSRYMVRLDRGSVVLDLPDAGVTRTLHLRYSEDPEVVALGAIEVDTTPDGWIHLLFYGVPESDETLDIGAFISVSPQGSVGPAEAIGPLWSPSDPGSPARLGTHPGAETVWIMVVGEDGVHVYGRDHR